MIVPSNRRYGVYCNRLTKCGQTLYRLVDNHTENENGFAVTVDKGYGDEEFERLKRRCDELNKEADNDNNRD